MKRQGICRRTERNITWKRMEHMVGQTEICAGIEGEKWWQRKG